ncbi:MAG: alpha/beta fold hydrolase [Flavobacterium sp.]|uniref:alpha/beta fold hydrolase n=1 Tax=Flavobacterium sp. TaxID=239 RepID=UPI001B0D1EEC|nr:alpha/beta fold hydrolase [Flavobacterium sp.]MBO9586227.1 alpha/beta fold hydrolase [Flavobacterium sp.]
MKKLITLLLILSLLPNYLMSQSKAYKFEKATTFFPGEALINEQNKVEWGYLTVPENWDKPTGKKIKIAVAVLKNTAKKEKANVVVYLEGGPGAGEVGSIWRWLDHPLRENNDLVLMDVRGTGYSSPKFCPDLGTKFLEILAKNQNSTQDEQQKTMAALACKQDLINKGIDLTAYNSKSIAKDLNALKEALKYDKWTVYGVSYGTYTAQVYANDFSQDINSLILDSSISDITEYYNSNTANYISSLNKVFEACENNPDCNQQYPNLEKTYYETIEKLTKNPITVDVDKKVIPSGKFTYNAEDFKIAIQQSLYYKKLIEVLPLLITEFNKGNKNTLSALVASFSGALGLDYGQYYCVSCNEVIPNNSILAFNKKANGFQKLKGGLSFYKSDFSVCDKWNSGINKTATGPNDLSKLATITAPVLVFSGAFDPITPPSNGKAMVNKFKNGFLVSVPTGGHGPGFSMIGSKIVSDFISNPTRQPDVSELKRNDKVNFATDVLISGGISNFANSLNEFDLLFFAPLFIAITILLVSVLTFAYLLVRNRKDVGKNKIMKTIVILTSLFAFITIIGFVLAINNTSENNFYILAFGIPNQFEYLFTIQWVFIVCVIISILYFVFVIKSISDTSVMAAILFSLCLIGIYFQYWGFLF